MVPALRARNVGPAQHNLEMVALRPRHRAALVPDAAPDAGRVVQPQLQHGAHADRVEPILRLDFVQGAVEQQIWAGALGAPLVVKRRPLTKDGRCVEIDVGVRSSLARLVVCHFPFAFSPCFHAKNRASSALAASGSVAQLILDHSRLGSSGSIEDQGRRSPPK